jgi:bacillithiol system protein YtxJ
MSFLNKLFGESNKAAEVSKVNWILLESVEQLEEIAKQSIEKPVLIFKHSTRCGISRMVLKQFENAFTLEENSTPYFLDLLEYRAISNEIASRFNVQHQSPQLIVIKDNIAVYNASHGSIDAADLKRFV